MPYSPNPDQHPDMDIYAIYFKQAYDTGYAFLPTPTAGKAKSLCLRLNIILKGCRDGLAPRYNYLGYWQSEKTFSLRPATDNGRSGVAIYTNEGGINLRAIAEKMVMDNPTLAMRPGGEPVLKPKVFPASTRTPPVPVPSIDLDSLFPAAVDSDPEVDHMAELLQKSGYSSHS